MLNKFFNSQNFEYKYLGADSSFGSSHQFLDSLPDNIIYFVDVKKNCQVFSIKPDINISELPNEKLATVISDSPSTVEDIAKDPRYPWQDVILGMGAKGQIISKDKCIRVVEVWDGKPRNPVWLYVRQKKDGTLKYALCNESIDASNDMVRKPALMRWSIEESFKEGKEHIGMDHYMLRSWVGWKRHMLLTFIAHYFITKFIDKFRAIDDSPQICPVILAPVTVVEYRNSVIKFRMNEPIDNPNLVNGRGVPVRILTIGLARMVIGQFHYNTKNLYNKVAYSMRKARSSLFSRIHSKMQEIFSIKIFSP
jgi:hypothetical protein